MAETINSRQCRGWDTRHYVKRRTSREWRRATKAALREGREPPPKRPIKGWAD